MSANYTRSNLLCFTDPTPTYCTPFQHHGVIGVSSVCVCAIERVEYTLHLCSHPSSAGETEFGRTWLILRFVFLHTLRTPLTIRTVRFGEGKRLPNLLWAPNLPEQRPSNRW